MFGFLIEIQPVIHRIPIRNTALEPIGNRSIFWKIIIYSIVHRNLKHVLTPNTEITYVKMEDNLNKAGNFAFWNEWCSGFNLQSRVLDWYLIWLCAHLFNTYLIPIFQIYNEILIILIKYLLTYSYYLFIKDP